MNRTINPHRVTVLGLGAMGARIASRLLESGHAVTVWNRSEAALEAQVARGATAAASPREAAEGADFVLSMVRDHDASRRVWLADDGALLGLGADAVAVEASTLTPAWIRELGEAMTSTGKAWVEAPVVGSRPQAEAGQLISLVGGERGAVERARPLLECYSSRVNFIGQAGLAAVAKLAINGLFAAQVAAASESVHLLRTAGVDDERWLDTFAHLPIVPPPLLGAMSGIAAGRFDPAFPVELVEKDLRYYSSTARESGARSPLTDVVRALFAEAVAAGFGHTNIHGVAQIYGDSPLPR